MTRSRCSRRFRWVLLGFSLCLVAHISLAGVVTVDAGRGPVNVYLPPSYDPEIPAPLLILLHGYSISGGQTEAFFQFQAHAEANGYLYAYPSGRMDTLGNLYWDATDFCCDIVSPNGDEDSIYLRDFIEAVEDAANVDPQRIWIVGYSNGGMMAHRLACDHSDKISAIASIAGAMYNPENADNNPDNGEDFCQPTQPVHVLEIHGTADGTILYEGGTINLPGTILDGREYPSAQETIDSWSNLNMCRTDVSEFAGAFNFTGPSEAETQIRLWPSECHVGSSSELWTMVGVGHSPSVNDAFRDTLFEFFNAHPKQIMTFSEDGEGNKNTITWLQTSSAASYRVYRGFLEDLVDDDEDGIPDGEYGACISQLDPDLADTTFVDGDTPSSGGGFFYVSSYVDNVPFGGGNEGGLGKCSSGLHRTNTIQCP